MAASFFFYDLETSGFDARSARVMQFAGQRTSLDLKPIGAPVNELIKLTPDVLPEPGAVLVTGITPQKTIADGITEAEFLKLFYEEAVEPDTIFVGFNSIRFDDEFMRFMHYRNFYDAYEWQWANGCSRWDILDVVRMTRALRPEGIEWPFASTGKPTNRLEYLTSVNKLDHAEAHDALSDVKATIAVARLLHSQQPDLFKYLLGMRDKKKLAALVETGQPFVYTTGRYPSEFWHTSVATRLTDHPDKGAVLVYDLRFDPEPFAEMSIDEIIAAWRYSKDPEAIRLPVKTLKYNRCPSVAPLGVIKSQATQERLQINLETVQKHRLALKRCQAVLADKVHEAIKRLDAERERTQATLVDDELTVDGRLYEGFFEPGDKQLMRAVRAADPSELGSFVGDFHDGRLKNLLPLYKARNYPNSLSPEERAEWDAYCHRQLLSGGNQSRLAQYFNQLSELVASDPAQPPQNQYLVEELQLYGQSIMPVDAVD